MDNDILDISHLKRLCFTYGSARIQDCEYDTMLRIAFPPGTRGYLYWHTHTHLPPYAGAIRFRICDKWTPSAFEAGHDLLQPNGLLPFELNLWQLALRPAFWSELIEDRVVSRESLEHCLKMLQQAKRKRGLYVICGFRHPFILNAGGSTTLWVAGKDTLERLIWTNLRGCNLPENNGKYHTFKAQFIRDKRDNVYMEVLDAPRALQPELKPGKLLAFEEAGSLLLQTKEWGQSLVSPDSLGSSASG